MKDRVLVVDSLNLFIRNFVIVPTIGNDGSPSGGFFGSLKSLQKLVKQIKPTKIIFVWDGTGGSKRRKKMFGEYKDGRAPVHLNRNIRNLSPDEEMRNKDIQLKKLIEYLNYMPVIQLIEDGVEADDIIARVCKLQHLSSMIKVIVSADKDFFQLCDDDTIVFRPVQEEIMNEKRIVEKFGIHPTNFALARAISGDSSDNLDGIGGAGLKTVAKRLEMLKGKETVSLTDLYAFCEQHVEKFKVYYDILSNKNKIELNYRMMQLYTPNLSPLTSRKVKETVENFQPEFQQTEIVRKMISDGINAYNWDILFQTFRSISSVGKVFKA